MRTFSLILFLSFISLLAIAQQVTKVDCCLDVGNKATIVINNTTNLIATNSISANTVVNNNGICNFKLDASANTSAGVYNASGNLIRTLWSGVRYDAGCYNVQWDGNLDDGTTAAPFGTYTIKVLTNNVAYDWLGVIGNSSASHIANQFLNPFYSMVSVNGLMFTAGGYAERDYKTNKFALSNIGAFYNAVDPTQSLTQTMGCYHVCTNGNYVFWAGGDPYSSAKSFIYASNPSDDSQVAFTNGQPVTIGVDGRQYHSTFIVSTVTDNVVNGMAATANFLFASRDSNKVNVYDLRGSSGILLRSITLGVAPGALTVYGTYLWAYADNAVKQYSIGADGVLTATGVTINISIVGDMQASLQGELAVLDNTTQQVKFFNAATGAATGTLGQAGGYNNGPAVTYDKFMFYGKANGANTPAFAYGPDGSFWLSDCGDYRVLHFNPDKSYKEQISYVPTSRGGAVDLNNPARVFADALEYQVDYSKVATDINNSWVLKNNWNIGTNLNVFGQLEQVVTLSNGHTYAIGHSGTTDLYDLRPSGAVLVGHLNFTEPTLEADGSIYTRTYFNANQAVVTKYALTGYDNNFMPQWGAAAVIATTPIYAEEQPFYYRNNTRGASTNQNRYFFFNPDPRTDSGLPIYHLGSIKTGGSSFDWKTSKQVSYQGPYPLNGNYYADGGHSENCMANINGSSVFWHVNNELGYLTEACHTNHYNEDGLLIGHFGTDNLLESYTGDTRFWAGNSFTTSLAKVGGDLYYFYCDESKHGGVHIIKVSNLASVQEQSIPVTVTAPVTIVPDPNNLMVGLSFKSTSLNNAVGWLVESGTPTLQTGLHQYSTDSVDVTIAGGTGDRVVSRYLGNQALSSYTVSGGVNFNQSQATFGDFNIYNYLALVDKAGKQVACLFSKSDGTYINNVKVAPYNYGDQNLFKDFTFTYASGVLTFKFSGYAPVTINATWDSGADIGSPGKLKVIQHVVNYRSDYTAMDLYKLRFKAN